MALAARLGVSSRLARSVPALGLLALGCGKPDTAIQYLREVRNAKLEEGWCERIGSQRALRVTRKGRDALGELVGLRLPAAA